MVEYRSSYIMELSPGVFRYALPKNLNSHAYNYLASALTKDPVEWDDGTYNGISYSKVYSSYDECMDALTRKYGNFGNYDGLTLKDKVLYSELPEIALDLIKCHKKDYPNYTYSITNGIVLNLALHEHLGLTDKDVSYVFTSSVGHLELEYNLDPSKHAKEDLYKDKPNLYFYDSRICPEDSHYSVKLEEKRPDFKYILVNEDTGTKSVIVDAIGESHGDKYIIGNSKICSLARKYYFMKGCLSLSHLNKPYELINAAYREYTEVLNDTSDMDVLYFESGELKSKEYFQSQGYKVYNG